jgi:cation diffusion facilitator family transporter
VGENMDIQGKKTRIAALSVASNSTLVVIILIVGLMIGSVAVCSEAIHSAMDLIASLIAFFAVRIAGKAADEDHQFGHTKVENISAAIEALLIFIAAAWIIYEAVQKLLNSHPIETVGWGVGVMLVSTIVNFIVSRIQCDISSKCKRLGRSSGVGFYRWRLLSGRQLSITDSPALALDSRSDS